MGIHGQTEDTHRNAHREWGPANQHSPGDVLDQGDVQQGAKELDGPDHNGGDVLVDVGVLKDLHGVKSDGEIA